MRGLWVYVCSSERSTEMYVQTQLSQAYHLFFLKQTFAPLLHICSLFQSSPAQ